MLPKMLKFETSDTFEGSNKQDYFGTKQKTGYEVIL